jgi:hypothetical protein
MLKKFLSVAAGLVVMAAVFAADAELKDGHPDVYVVQKGDTLWDISARFLKQPWLWPEIWHANPQIQNPHLIYPGDRLSLEYIEGRPQIVASRGRSGNGKLSPHIRSEPIDSAVSAVPLAEVEPFLKHMRMIGEDDAKGLPYVVAVEENQVLSAAGETVYVRGLRAEPGAHVVIMRPTNSYRDVPEHFPWKSSTRKTVADEWTAETDNTLAGYWRRVAVNRWYKRNTELLGYEVLEIGDAEVLRSGDPSTLLVRYSDIEVKKGDLVMPAGELPYDLSFVPHAPKRIPDNMRVVASTDTVMRVGPHQVVALTKGARDGVEDGQVYAVFHPGDRIRDTIEYPENDVRATFPTKRIKVTLPEEYVAHVMVFRTFEKMSYGLVMDGIRPVTLYDKLHGPEAE